MAHETLSLTEYQAFLNADERIGLWATAFVTELEDNLLRRRLRELMNVGRGRISNIDLLAWAGNQLIQELSVGNWPEIDEVTAMQFMEAAVAHGCPVAFPLYHDENRSPRTTVLSYLMKNRAFRFVNRVLRGSNSPLQVQWQGVEQKQPEETGVVELIRPAHMADNQLQGVEKVEVYWWCQLMRVLDGIDKGWDRPDNISPQMAANFHIPWSNFSENITQAQNIADLDLSTGLKLIQILRQRNVPPKLIAEVLLRGYDPVGPLKEHGQQKKIRGSDSVWARLLAEIAIIDEEVYRELALPLRSRLASYDQQSRK